MTGFGEEEEREAAAASPGPLLCPSGSEVRLAQPLTYPQPLPGVLPPRPGELGLGVLPT